MSRKTIKIFMNEIYSKPPKKNYPPNKTDVYHIDDIWSVDILDIKAYGPEKNRTYRYVLVVIDTFPKFGWTIPLKNKNAPKIEDFWENILIASKRKPNLFKTDRDKGFYNKIFQNFLDKNNIKYNLEVAHSATILQKGLIELLEILWNDHILKSVTGTGLIYWLQ